MNDYRVTYRNVIDGKRHVLMGKLTLEQAGTLALNMTEEGLPGCRVGLDDGTRDGAEVSD